MLINSSIISQENIRLNIRYILISKSLYQLSINFKFTCEDILKPYVSIEDLKKACQVLNFESYENTKDWLKPYECNYKDCKNKEIESFSKNTGINKETIDKIYNDNDSLLVKNLNEIESLLSTQYKCKSICTDIELAKVQFLNSSITLNPIELLKETKTNSLNNLDREVMKNKEYELNISEGNYENFIDKNITDNTSEILEILENNL